MSEGELKKRIREKLYQHCDIREGHQSRKEFDNIVDEARKDILESAFMTAGMPYLLGDGVTLVMDTQYAELKLGALVRSILKWFGEMKKC